MITEEKNSFTTATHKHFQIICRNKITSKQKNKLLIHIYTLFFFSL